MSQLTPAQAAERLGIPPEDRDAFTVLADRMRNPAGAEAELEALRNELAAVNAALHKAGIDHPTGARGVRDLAGFVRRADVVRSEAVDEAARRISDYAERLDIDEHQRQILRTAERLVRGERL